MKKRTRRILKRTIITFVALAAAACAGLGVWLAIEEKNRETDVPAIAGEIDPSSPASVAAALYQCIMSDNFEAVPELAAMMRAAVSPGSGEEDAAGGNPPADAEPIDISGYLTDAAVASVRGKLQQITGQLNSLETAPDTYAFYLNSLGGIFEVYRPRDDRETAFRDGITAYLAFRANPDYTVHDIRSIFGPFDALRVAAFLIGSRDYSRSSPYEIREFVEGEIKSLLETLPSGSGSSPRGRSAADFAGFTPETADFVKKLSEHLPVFLAYVPMIDDPEGEDNAKTLRVLRQAYSSRVGKTLTFAYGARSFYRCAVATGEPFILTGKTGALRFMNAASLGKIPLNVFGMSVSNSPDECRDLREVFILAPDPEQYLAVMKRGLKKMSDAEINAVRRDIALLNRLSSPSDDPLTVTLLGSDVAAVENPLEQRPEPGRFVGIREGGPLYNISLPSMEMFESLEISPDTRLIFTPEGIPEKNRAEAAERLALVDGIVAGLEHMKTLDFDLLELSPGKFVAHPYPEPPAAPETAPEAAPESTPEAAPGNAGAEPLPAPAP